MGDFNYNFVFPVPPGLSVPPDLTLQSSHTPPSEGSTPPGPVRPQYTHLDTSISKAQMNRMIMDYLVKHGYSQAALDFGREAGIKLDVDINTIEQRKKIKNAIYAGQLQTAIEEINEIDSTILEQDKDLHFQLLNLQLVELIKEENAKENSDIFRCVNFAQENLAPRAPREAHWKAMLEKTMALLMFDHKNLIPEVSAVLSPDLRIRVAIAANQAVLRATGESPTAGLVELLQTRVYAQKEAESLNTWPADGMNIGLKENSGERTESLPPTGNPHSDDEPMAE